MPQVGLLEQSNERGGLGSGAQTGVHAVKERDICCLEVVRDRGIEKRQILGWEGNGESSHQVSDNFSRTGAKVITCGRVERGKKVASSLEGVGKF